MQERHPPNETALRIFGELAKLGADLTAWDGRPDLGGPAGLWTPPRSPVGDYVSAVRLLGHEKPQAPAEPVADIPGATRRLIARAGLDVDAWQVSRVAATDQPEPEDQTPAGNRTLELAFQGRRVLIRPGQWRGTAEGVDLAEAINSLAGERVLGCALECGDWRFFRTNDDIDRYVEAMLTTAAKPMTALASDVLRLYRPHGFFQDLDHLLGERAALELSCRVVQRFGVLYVQDVNRTSRPLLELTMLATDANRMWWVHDAEHAAPPSTALLDTLYSWCRVSAGAMTVDKAQVTQEGHTSTIKLEATVNGSTVTLQIGPSDWIPTAALQQVLNEAVAPSHHVVAATTGYQDTFATVASGGLLDLLHDRGLPMTSAFTWQNGIR